MFYLAGPMSGIPHFNFPLFNAVARKVRAAGHKVFNPADADTERHGGVNISNPTGDQKQAAKEHGFSLRQALGDDTQFIAHEAGGIIFLPGWEFSNGALAEFFLARAIAKDPNGTVPFRFIYVQKIGPDLYDIPGIGTLQMEAVLA